MDARLCALNSLKARSVTLQSGFFFFIMKKKKLLILWNKTRKIMNVSVLYPELLHAVNWQLQSIKMQRGLWDGSSREGWALCLELRWRAWAAALRGVIAAPPSSLFDTQPKTHLFLPPSCSLSFFDSFSAALSFPILSVGECWFRFFLDIVMKSSWRSWMVFS